MSSTIDRRAWRLTDRWLRQNGSGLVPLESEALHLLGSRLIARRRAMRAFVAGAVVSLAAAWGLADESITGLREDGTTPWSSAAGWYLVVAECAMVAGALVLSAIQARADRAAATALPRRVTRSAPVRLVDVAGRRVVAAVAVAGLAVVVLCVVSWLAAPGWPAGAVTAACAVATLGSAAAMALAVRRPAVAADAVGLAVDERLRRADVVLGAQLLVIGLVLLNGVRPFIVPYGTPPVLGLAWFAALLPIVLLQFVLLLPHRWPTAAPLRPTAGQVPVPQPPAGTP